MTDEKKEQLKIKYQSRTFLFALLWTLMTLIGLAGNVFLDVEVPLGELITAAASIVALFMTKGAIKEWRRPTMTLAQKKAEVYEEKYSVKNQEDV